MSTSPASAVVVRSMNWLRAWLSLPAPMRSASAASPLLDRVELADVVADPFVAQLGQLGLLDLRDVDDEVGRFLGAVGGRREGQLVAGIRADQFVVEARRHPAVADFVQPVLGVEPGDRFAVAGRGERDGDLVARLDGAVDVDQRALSAQLGLDRFVDVGLGGLGRRQLDPQSAVAGHRDLRSHLAHGVERDRAGFAAARELDVGRGDEIDVVLADGIGEVHRHGIAERLLACGCQPDAGLEHLAGHLALAEAG